MKITAILVLGFSVGIAAGALAQTGNASDVTNQPGYATRNTGIGTTSKNAGGSGATPDATPDESNTAEHDDSLYRGKTDEMENQLLRDDGMLHFKTHPKEKTEQVDAKKLPSSGTDRKFQGEFATSGVSSIDRIGAKTTVKTEARPANPADQIELPSEDRFVLRHMTFNPPADETSKKAEADSSPSPTPSPSSSPATRQSGDSKK